MNVDVLNPPPPWWWYLPIALGTIFISVGIWIIFKRNETVRLLVISSYPVVTARALKIDMR
jgi:hypothetical protein